MATSTRVRTALKVIPALFVLSACASYSASTSDPFQGAEGRNEIRIYVENDNYYDARVYALLDGIRRSLGSVGGKTEGVFTMPLAFSQDLRIEIDMLAGDDCVTDALPVDPGDIIRLQILPDPLSSEMCR